jgi:transcriptional regulator with XRE-family HTH domain
MKYTKSCVHTYAMLLMGEQGLSQTSLAHKAGVTVTTINQILLGKRVSASVQQLIAESLGFDSWEALENAALHFSDLFASMYNRPTQRPKTEETDDVDRRKNVI